MDLSVLIAARNEEFLPDTIADVLSHIEADTEVIAVLDGPGNPPIPVHPRVQIIRYSESVGQRGGVNEAARLSRAKYVMKMDAHCSVDQGFDVKLMKPYESGEIDMRTTTIPRMYNLHVFDWVCKTCGNHTYQGPRPTRCEPCKAERQFERLILWKPRLHKRTDFARFDKELHFQYWRDYEKREGAKGDLADVMCFVGACFFMPREWYWYLEGLDESHGSWGQMGVEVSCKSWLSGGRQIVNKRTWFSHLFRTQPGFGFPYPNPGIGARRYSQDLWRNNKWPKQTRRLSWLINKFTPVPEWEDYRDNSNTHTVSSVKSDSDRGNQKAAESESNSRGIVYYTDNRIDDGILRAVQDQIKRSCNGHKIVTVSLKPMEFGYNRVLDLERGVLTMFRQILLGLIDCDADVIFLCEHDVLYHPSHFEFMPEHKNIFYYNTNTWKVDSKTGHALHYYTMQTSGLCAYRDLLIEHYTKRIERVEREGFSRQMGYEPGTHTFPRGVDNYGAKPWQSTYPNIDIRHGNNLTASRWRKEEFRSQRSCREWQESDRVPGWGQTEGRFNEFLAEVGRG